MKDQIQSGGIITIEYNKEDGCGFTDMGNGTVRDNDTGLMWLKDASCSELAGTDWDGRAYWQTAMNAAASLSDGTCNLTDGSSAGVWRLPTNEEWEAFVDTSYINPALSNGAETAQWSEGNAFLGVQSYLYWSSLEIDINSALGVNMIVGNVSGFDKASGFYVWPVRSDN